MMHISAVEKRQQQPGRDIFIQISMIALPQVPQFFMAWSQQSAKITAGWL